MAIIDRRSGDDRRAHERFSVNINIQWGGGGGGAAGRKKGTISDVSLGGCFVLSSGEVEDGEKVALFLTLKSGSVVELTGEVVNHVFEIGFGVRFIEQTKAQKQFLARLVETLRKN